MHECILKLLGYAEQRGDGGGGGKGGGGERKLVRVVKEWDEESLEALCKLLTTVGKQLDDVKTGGAGGGGKGRPPPQHHDKDMAFYYDRLRELSVDKKSGLAARARFMIKDILELRENNWVPRRAEAKATKTEEFRREIEAAKPGGPPPPAPGKGGGGGGGSRGGPGSPSPALQRQGSGEKGRGGGGEKRAGGGGGGGGAAGGMGRSGPELRDRRGSIPPGGLRGAGGRHGAPSPVSSLDHDEEAAAGGRGQRGSLGDSSGSARGAAPAPAPSPGAASMPRSKVEQCVQGMMAEFLDIKSEEEADASMEQLPREVGSEVAAHRLLSKLCDCKDSDRPLLVQLLLALVKGERVLPAHLQKEVQEVLELLEDIVVDVPHVYDNFAVPLAALLRTKALDFAWFQREARRALPEDKAFARLMVAVFRAVDGDRRAPWSWDLVKTGGPVPFEAYRDRGQWMAFVAEHQLWATYVEPLSAKIVEEARAGGGTNGILAWVRSLDPGLRNSVPFTRALAYRLLVECPKLPRTMFPQVPELCTLFTEIAARADARLQVACLHGIQRFAFDAWGTPSERRSMLVQLFEELVKAGAILPGTLSAWEQDLKETPDKVLAQDVVAGVMGKLGADPLAA